MAYLFNFFLLSFRGRPRVPAVLPRNANSICESLRDEWENSYLGQIPDAA